MAGRFVGRDGRVGAHDLLGLAWFLAGYVACEGDVLADGQAENVCGMGKREAVASMPACQHCIKI